MSTMDKKDIVHMVICVLFAYLSVLRIIWYCKCTTLMCQIEIETPFKETLKMTTCQI